MNRRICSLLAVMALISGASISGSQAENAELKEKLNMILSKLS